MGRIQGENIVNIPAKNELKIKLIDI